MAVRVWVGGWVGGSGAGGGGISPACIHTPHEARRKRTPRPCRACTRMHAHGERIAHSTMPSRGATCYVLRATGITTADPESAPSEVVLWRWGGCIAAWGCANRTQVHPPPPALRFWRRAASPAPQREAEAAITQDVVLINAHPPFSFSFSSPSPAPALSRTPHPFFSSSFGIWGAR
jgi:hypothetical protein